MAHPEGWIERQSSKTMRKLDCRGSGQHVSFKAWPSFQNLIYYSQKQQAEREESTEDNLKLRRSVAHLKLHLGTNPGQSWRFWLQTFSGLQEGPRECTGQQAATCCSLCSCLNPAAKGSLLASRSYEMFAQEPFGDSWSPHMGLGYSPGSVTITYPRIKACLAWTRWNHFTEGPRKALFSVCCAQSKIQLWAVILMVCVLFPLSSLLLWWCII